MKLTIEIAPAHFPDFITAFLKRRPLPIDGRGDPDLSPELHLAAHITRMLQHDYDQGTRQLASESAAVINDVLTVTPVPS